MCTSSLSILLGLCIGLDFASLYQGIMVVIG
jgi:hypothetical protein